MCAGPYDISVGLALALTAHILDVYSRYTTPGVITSYGWYRQGSVRYHTVSFMLCKLTS